MKVKSFSLPLLRVLCVLGGEIIMNLRKSYWIFPDFRSFGKLRKSIRGQLNFPLRENPRPIFLGEL